MRLLQLDPDVAEHIELFRDIRLRALRTDPSSFGSTHDREAGFDEAAWRARVTTFAGRPGAVFVAHHGALAPSDVAPSVSTADVVGVVGVGASEHRDDATIWGMWVSPDGRRRGTANRLLDAAERWAGDCGAHTATLWAHGDNTPAIALYRRRGYIPIDPAANGLSAPDGCRDERCLRVSFDGRA